MKMLSILGHRRLKKLTTNEQIVVIVHHYSVWNINPSVSTISQNCKQTACQTWTCCFLKIYPLKSIHFKTK